MNTVRASRRIVLWAAALAAVATLRPAVAKSDAMAFPLPRRLAATWSGAHDVVLRWEHPARADAGCWVEYTTPGAPFIQLDAITDPAMTTFVHRNVAPDTVLQYRLEPFFGRPTAPLAIMTGAAPKSDTPPLPAGPIDPPPVDTVPRFALRSARTFAAAMPVELTATLSSATSVDLRWRDRSSDEDGFLVELAARPDGRYVACALLPPNVTSFRKTELPPHQRCYFRVRAFFYGPPTEVVSVRTPPAPRGFP